VAGSVDTRVERLAALLRERGGRIDPLGGEAMTVRGVRRDDVGDLAGGHGIALHELVEQRSSLEDVFFELTEQEGLTPR
jgi:ABC-2 type transport system ATP-binding protein